jgi:hypothetical protein
MGAIRSTWLSGLALFATLIVPSAPTVAQQQQRPNIVFIMGDDIGMWRQTHPW